jgi:hypothetical protein
MKLAAIDFLALRKSLFAAILMAASGAAAVHYSLDASGKAALKLAAAQRERNEFARRLDRVRSEEDEIKAKSQLFNALKAKGVIGPERRLEWVELIKEISERRQLIDLRYEFAPQRALDAKPGDAFAFHASNMKLQLQLLHEEDLTRLIGDLRARAQAVVQVKSCSLSRLPPREHGTARAFLRGECELDWITLREPASKQESR